MTKIVISGAGIAGLILALYLEKFGLKCEIYEQAPGFDEGVGGAIGLYPNGLRVIRDISEELLNKVRAAGRPYLHRRWMRHDGSEVAVGDERFLCQFKNEKDAQDLSSMGVRRWKLQKVLVDAVIAKNIPIYLNQRINSVELQNDNTVLCKLNNKEIRADLVFGCDGVKSAIRQSLFGMESEPKYTGITCLMGSAPIAKNSPISGICFPSSSTTNCHACYYPCSDTEIIFQLYFPTEEKPETWKALTIEESKKECIEIQKMLIKDGWNRMFTDPIGSAESVLRVGLRARSPIPIWHAPQGNPRVFLLGDAAHPPVPYIGQGAMMAIEDVGILSLLIQKLCKPTIHGNFQFNNLPRVAELYQKLRYSRTTEMLKASESLGKMQLSRGQSNWLESTAKELQIWLNVKWYGTLPVMFQGSGYNYSEEIQKVFTAAKL